jgi:hypothetical protein
MSKREYNRKVTGKGVYQGQTCRGPECTNPAVVHWLCNSHYSQIRRGGTLKPVRKYVKYKDTEYGIPLNPDDYPDHP